MVQEAQKGTIIVTKRENLLIHHIRALCKMIFSKNSLISNDLQFTLYVPYNYVTSLEHMCPI